jgi:hypothetical protein
MLDLDQASPRDGADKLETLTLRRSAAHANAPDVEHGHEGFSAEQIR